MKYVLILVMFLGCQAFAQLSESVSISQVSVNDLGHCNIKKSTKILKGSELISENAHRWVVDPEGDLSFLDSELSKISVTEKNHKELEIDIKRAKLICKSGWTPEAIKKDKAAKAKADALFKR